MSFSYPRHHHVLSRHGNPEAGQQAHRTRAATQTPIVRRSFLPHQRWLACVPCGHQGLARIVPDCPAFRVRGAPRLPYFPPLRRSLHGSGRSTPSRAASLSQIAAELMEAFPLDRVPGRRPPMASVPERRFGTGRPYQPSPLPTYDHCGTQRRVQAIVSRWTGRACPWDQGTAAAHAGRDHRTAAFLRGVR